MSVATTTPTPDAGPRRPDRPTLEMSPAQRLGMVACGYVPFLNVVVIVTLAWFAARPSAPGWAWALPVAWLLLVPPLVVRVVLAVRPLPGGEAGIGFGDRGFLAWWFTSQWQVIFNRLPWIEELIRLVPGLYSLWLRLWGARVGSLVYWTPGLRILDRPLVRIGSRVVFGVGVRVNPHIIMPDTTGRLVLRVAPVTIGNDVLVGGYSTLFAGCWIGDGETSPGRREIRPFTGWIDGRRVGPATTDADRAHDE